MKLLFIDHECHKKTHSAEFFLSVVRKAFDVVEHWHSMICSSGIHKYSLEANIFLYD